MKEFINNIPYKTLVQFTTSNNIKMPEVLMCFSENQTYYCRYKWLRATPVPIRFDSRCDSVWFAESALSGLNLSDLGLIFVVFLSDSDFLAASITTHNQNGADVTTSRCHGDAPSDLTLDGWRGALWEV